MGLSASLPGGVTPGVTFSWAAATARPSRPSLLALVNICSRAKRDPTASCGGQSSMLQANQWRST